MTELTDAAHDCDGWDSCPNPAHRISEPGEAHYVEFGWSGCAGSAWRTLSPAAKDGWAHAERIAAGLQHRMAEAWNEGWNAAVDSNGFPGDVNPYRDAALAAVATRYSEAASAAHAAAFDASPLIGPSR